MDFCLYENIDDTCFEQFNYYWEKYAQQLPGLPTLLHNKEEGKATVFNSWIRYSHFNHLLILKTEKSLTHSFPDYLSNWIKSRIPERVKFVLLSRQQDSKFLFFFAYNLSRLVLNDMEHFVSQYDQLKNALRAEDYYSSSEKNLFSDDPVFKLIKVLTSTYINAELTEEKCHVLFFTSLQLTLEQLHQLTKS